MRTQITDVQTVSFVGMVIDQNVLNNYLNDIYNESFFIMMIFCYKLTLCEYKIYCSPEINFIHDISIQGYGVSALNGKYIIFTESCCC